MIAVPWVVLDKVVGKLDEKGKRDVGREGDWTDSERGGGGARFWIELCYERLVTWSPTELVDERGRGDE